jgi:hypothetical protein
LTAIDSRALWIASTITRGCARTIVPPSSAPVTEEAAGIALNRALSSGSRPSGATTWLTRGQAATPSAESEPEAKLAATIRP